MLSRVDDSDGRQALDLVDTCGKLEACGFGVGDAIVGRHGGLGVMVAEISDHCVLGRLEVLIAVKISVTFRWEVGSNGVLRHGRAER